MENWSDPNVSLHLQLENQGRVHLLDGLDRNIKSRPKVTAVLSKDAKFIGSVRIVIF